MFAHRSSFALLLALGASVVIGCGSRGGDTDTPATAAETGAVTADMASTAPVVSLSARFSRYLVAPDGRVDGMLLDDGTAVRFPPDAAHLDPAKLRQGDIVKVDGHRVTTPTGSVIVHAVVKKDDVTLVDRPSHPERGPRAHGDGHAEGPPPAHEPGAGPPPGFGPPGFGPPGFGMGHGPGRGHGPDHARAELPAQTSKGTVVAMLARPGGPTDTLLMSDGATVRLPPMRKADRVTFHVGDTLELTGRGTASTYGTGMVAESVKLANGETKRLAPEHKAPIAFERTATISRTLVAPFGAIDGLLLDDGSLVRLPPWADASKLVAGTKLSISGDQIGGALLAKKIATPAGATLFEMPDRDKAKDAAGPRARGEHPQAKERPALVDIQVDGAIAKVFASPMGSPDTLLLADGSIVKVPPPMADDAGNELVPGAKIQVSGKGGRYDGSVSMFATKLTLPSGTALTAPERPHMGRPGHAPRQAQ